MKLFQYAIVAGMVVWMTGCSESPEVHYDGAALLKGKCASCHNLDMPPKTYEDEKAPPMMAVAFHVKDFMKVENPSEKRPKFIDFFKDYVLHPDAKKSFCDKESLVSYDVMPSQKGKVTAEEVGAIAAYVYDYYDQEKFMEKMKAKAYFDALPKGEQLATKNGCLTCHGKEKAKAAPAFREIAKKSREEIAEAIRNGSRGKWKGFERMSMPAYGKRLNDHEIEALAAWIAEIGSKK